MPILPSQCHLCNMRMPFMQPMPIVQIRKCHLCTQCQLCAQCHFCMLHNAKYASGAQLALLHIWHCEWHCVMSYYAIQCVTMCDNMQYSVWQCIQDRGMWLSPGLRLPAPLHLNILLQFHLQCHKLLPRLLASMESRRLPFQQFVNFWYIFDHMARLP